MQKKYLKKGRNKQYFLSKRKDNKLLYGNIKALRKQIIRLHKEKIDLAHQIYENVSLMQN